jgi:hypothetical protein
MTRRPMVVSGGEGLGVPASPSGSRPSDRAADGVSPVPASIPNAAWRVEDRSANMFNIVEGKDYFDKTIIAFTANGVGMEYANLIAAAPELLERLEDFCAIVKDDELLAMDPDLADAVASANAVIAKARGESQ